MIHNCDRADGHGQAGEGGDEGRLAAAAGADSKVQRQQQRTLCTYQDLALTLDFEGRLK